MGHLYLLTTFGLPGAGKSTFTERFSAEHQLFYWRGDEVRRRLFDKPQHSADENQLMSRAARYALGQALRAGVSCVYDINHNQRSSRQQYRELAAVYDATLVVLQFDVPEAVARRRTQDRVAVADADWQRYYLSFDPEFIDRLKPNMQPPGPEERIIRLDGQADYARQAETVLQQLPGLLR